MEGLRWLLLLFGIIVVVGVYYYGRRERSREKTDTLAGRRVAPILEDAGQSSESNPPGQVDDDLETAEAGGKDLAERRQKIVTLRIVARDRGFFRGDELALSLRGLGMRHGKFGIFHRYEGVDDNKTIFSAASLVEPGSFDMANIKDQEIPGISLFLVLPGPIDGAEAFDMMMAAARTLAQSLNAELLDESGSNLSIQRERYLREEIIQFQHSNLVA